MLIKGKNQVLEALRSDLDVEKVFLEKGRRDAKIQEILELARQKGVPVNFLPSLESKYPGCRGAVAQLSEIELAEEEEVLSRAPVLCLDGVEDPANLGAVLRCADAFAASVVLPKRHSAPLSEVAVKTSAGAAFHVPVHRTSNLPAFIERAKEAGFWAVYAEADAEVSLSSYSFPEKVLIVVGSEGKGVRKSVKGACDEGVRIPMGGKINSLNVSVAAGILLYAYFIQHREGK